MYSLTQTVKDLFQSKPWGVEMTIAPTSGSVLNVTDANIVMGSLTVDRYVSTGSGLPIGTATAGQLSFTLDNTNHDFDGVVFAGADIDAKFYVIDPSDNSYVYLPIGKFTIDEAPRILKSISIVALDAMVQFDVLPDLTGVFPCTVKTLVETLATAAGFNVLNGDIVTDITQLPNYSYLIPSAPDNIGELTARQLLQYCCQIMGVNAQIGRDGKIYLLEYSTTPSDTFDEKKRYSSDIREDITVTGISIASSDNDVATAGVDGYVLEIKDNPLIQTDPSVLLNDLFYLWDTADPIVFAPFTAVVVPVPWYDPMDVVTFTKTGVGHTVFVTKVQQTVNGNTALEGTGLSETQKGYATIDPLTVRQMQILRDIRTRTTEQVTQAEQNAIDFSQIVGNALGLFTITETNLDGSTTYYFADKESLDDASVIYTFNAGGFAFTNNWNGGSPTWSHGVANMGASSSAIFTYLTTHQITADHINVSTIRSNEITIATDSNGNHVLGGDTLEGIVNTEMADTIASAEASAETLAGYSQQLFIGDLNERMPTYFPDSGTMGVAIIKKVDTSTVPVAVFMANRLSFRDDSGYEVAWISSSQLHINNAEIMESLKMGGYRWMIESNGSVSLRWVGVNN